MKPTALLYLGSHGLSLLGNSIAGIALPLILLQATGSILSAGFLAVATAVPAFLAGLFTGVLIDRINRRTASIAADLISAVSLAALPVVDVLTGLDLGWFIIFGILGSFGDIPGLTAREAMLPAIVRSGNIPAEKLLGIRESISAVILVAGPVSAGGLMVAFDGSAILWITAGTSAAAAVLTLFLPRSTGRLAPAPGQTAARASAWDQLRQGWDTLFRRDPLLRAVTLLTLVLVTVLVALQGILLPAHFSALDQPEFLGFTLAALAAGTLAGSVLYTVRGPRWTSNRWLGFGLAGTLVGLAAVSALPPWWVLFAGAFVLGTASGLFGCASGVLLIDRIPEEMRGRILGTQNSLALLAAPAGMVGAAAVAERFGLPAAGLALAALLAIAAAALRSGLRLPTEPAAPGTMVPERMVANEKQ